MPHVNLDKCVGCGTCAENCPVQAITIVDGKAKINQDKCIDCNICVTVCPEGAMESDK